MSLVIKMDMSKSCAECPLAYTDKGDDPYFGTWIKRCVFNACVIADNGRHYDCPILCELPDKHGRLIDADKLKQNWIFRGISARGERQTIDEAPTIIEAEDENGEDN